MGENLRCKITDFGMARDIDLQDIYIPRNQVVPFLSSYPAQTVSIMKGHPL